VQSLLTGTLLEYQRKLEKNLFGLRLLFWKREAARQIREILSKIQSMVGLHEVASSPWPAISDVNGVIVIPDEGSHNWQLYSIVGGLPTAVHPIKGEWETKICQGGFGKRILEKLDRDMRARKQGYSYNASDLARLNAVLWWLQFGKARDRGVFLSFDEFVKLLSAKSKRTKSAPDTGTQTEVN